MPWQKMPAKLSIRCVTHLPAGLWKQWWGPSSTVLPHPLLTPSLKEHRQFMASEALRPLRVEVIYARPESIWRRQLEVSAGITAVQAVELSGVLQQHAELAGASLALGIFGRSCSPNHVLKPGDRVEIYRPLVFDPMESRRRRQQHRQRQTDARKSSSGNPRTPPRAPRQKLSES